MSKQLTLPTITEMRFFNVLLSECEEIAIFLTMKGCGHCLKMKPTVQGVCTEIHRVLSPDQLRKRYTIEVPLGCGVFQYLNKIKQFTGFPTLIIFDCKTRKIVGEFKGKRTTDDIKDFIKPK